MALIAHWPLNGNTNDISGNGLHGTPTNITYVNGKIGLAGEFNRPNTHITTSNQLTETMEFSFSTWVKTDSTATQTIVCSRTTVGGGFSIFILGQKIRFDSGASWQWSTGYTVPLNQWVHITVTRSSSGRKLFVNGSLVASTTAPGDMLTLGSIMSFGASQANGTGWGNYLSGNLNDLRLYDTALTEMEIQEIARAKIIHYTFDDMQEPTTNKFLQFTEDGLAPTAGDGNPTNLGLDSNNTFRGLRSVKFQTGASGNFYINGSAKIATDVTSTQWTASIYIKRVDGAPITSVGTYMYITNNANNNTDVDVEPVEDGWYKVTRTRTGLTAGYPTLFGCHNLGVGVQYYIAMWQIEAKDHDTEYVKGSRTAKVKDYSGFFNHSDPLTETTTPRWTPEAKIGTGAYKLDGNNYFLIHKYNASNDASLSLWFKSDLPTSTSQVVIGSPSSISFGIHNNTIIGMATTSSPVGLLSGSPYTVGQWNHIVITRDVSNVMSYYINGVKISNGANNNWGWNDDPYGIIGRRTLGNAGSAYYTNGEIDDIRVYSTTLSEKDIKDLYETRAEIEESGTLWAHDFKQRPNLLEPVNQAIRDKQFKNGLSSYTQSNTQVSITDDGLRIYRTPDVNQTDNGNTMWGGMRIRMDNLPGGVPLEKNRSYRLIINTNGKSTRGSSTHMFSNNMGWGGGGLLPNPTTIGRTWKGVPDNFDGTHNIIWEFKIEDDVYKVCTNSYSSFVVGQTYLSYADLQLGWGYEDTGDGTEVYITGVYLYDITDDDTIGISNKGIGIFDEYSTVGITEGLIGYWDFKNGDLRDYSGSNYIMEPYNSTSMPDVEKDGLVFDGSHGLKIEDLVSDISQKPFSFVIDLEVYSNESKRIAMGYPTNVLELGTNQGILTLSSKDSNGWTTASSGSKLLNERFLYTGTFDGNQIIYYQNAEQKAEFNGHKNDVSLSNHLLLGNWTSMTQGFIGKMYSVKVFNRALTAEEIAIEYNTMFNNEVQIHESGVLYAKDLKQY